MLIFLVVAGALEPGTWAQTRTPIDHYLSPAYPYELVPAKKTDRIAWLAFERGMRNVYTAAAPAFTPVRVTRNLEDDGIDMSGLSISDDGSTVVFVRGHAANRAGWVANPMSNPDGAEREIWAARTAGGAAWKVAVVRHARGLPSPSREENGAPVLSPDGRSVLYVKDHQIYRAAVAAGPAANAPSRGEKPFITAWGENGSPRWSPDGTKVAFVSNRGDHTLIGVYDVARHTVSWVSPSVDHDTSPAWSADSKRLAFVRRPGTPFGLQTQGGGTGIGNPPGTAVNRPGGGGGNRGGSQPRQESTIPGLTRAIFRGGYTLSFWVADIPGALSRDDGSIESPAREVWHDQPNDETFARVNSIQWAADRLIFEAEPEEWIRYFSVPAVAGGAATPVVLTPGDGMVEHVSVSRDGAHLYYATNAGDIDRRHLWMVPTAGGTAVQLTSGPEIETFPAVLASGTRVAVLSAAPARPQSVAVVDTVKSPAAVKVIFPSLAATFPAANHVVPQNVTLTADDGMKFNNQLFVPKGLRPGEKRPAVVFVHGGPSRQMLLGYHYMHFYHMAYGVNQWLAENGYVVLSVNYRRGIGYGRSFRTAPDSGGQGNAEYRDVLAAGKYLQTRDDVDRDRIGIWGLSYGGVLTAQALARNSDIFKVGVDLAGVHLWGNSIEPDSVSFKSSAIGAIGSWKSPVLLLHGDDDRNVAFAQTTGLVQLLRAHNVEHELIVFPDDVHDSLLYKRWIYTFDRTREFLQRYLGAVPRSTTERQQ
jgi:dipeptidyl aminopeptidase/acylaminoacyl peptidase